MSSRDNVIYSAIVRRGPDLSHYDVYLEGDRIVLRYLGEHWEAFRPRTGLQKRMDLFVYSMRKKRRRLTGEQSPDDIVVDICNDVVSVELVKNLEKGIGRLVLRTRRLGSLEIEYPLKIHEVAKRMYKAIAARLETCRSER